MQNRILNIKTVGSLILILLLSFIFFSKTLYTYNLPTVTAVSPSTGKLNKSETTSGILEWASYEELYSDVSGKIETVLVGEGDRVAKGQALLNLSFDEDDINNSLKDLETEKTKIELEIENINLRIERANRYIAELEEELYEEDYMSDYELTKIHDKIEKSKEDYEKLLLLYEVGAITKQELDNMEYEILNLQSEYEKLEKDIIEAHAKTDKLLDDKEIERSKKLQSYMDELQGYEQDLKAKDIDLLNNSIRKSRYEKTLADYRSSTTIYSSTDGIITSLPVNTGQYLNTNQLIMSFAVGNTFEIVSNLSLENNFVSVGDIAKLRNSTYAFEAEVTKITALENYKEVTLSIASDEVSEGETFEIEFSKESENSYKLVPNGAVNQDNDGYYLNQIGKREGLLGEEYYIERIPIYIGDSDNENTVVTRGIDFFEPIVLLSDKPFSENETVKVRNAGDFFES